MSRMTMRELDCIIGDYAVALPEWNKVGRDVLARTNGLVGQSIWFDRLRTGDYRPTVRTHVFAAPEQGEGAVVLTQFLGVKNREIAPSSHKSRFPAVLLALRTEIVPTVTEPLDALNVASLLSKCAAGRPADTYALACLYAALGCEEDARMWIDEYGRAVRAVRLPPQEVDLLRVATLREIEEWLTNSTAVSKLAVVAAEERGKFVKSA